MTLYDFIHTTKGHLESQGIIFCYNGYLTEDTLLGIGNAIRRKLEIAQIDKNTARSVFAIFVEEAQNIIRYSTDTLTSQNDPTESLRHGFIGVGKMDDQFFVICSNLVNQDDVPRLTAHLEHIKSLNDVDLKALYKQTLRGEVPEGSKGAGVGLIDIARRSKGGFDFDFGPADDSYTEFCLKAFV